MYQVVVISKEKAFAGMSFANLLWQRKSPGHGQGGRKTPFASTLCGNNRRQGLKQRQSYQQ